MRFLPAARANALSSSAGDLAGDQFLVLGPLALSHCCFCAGGRRGIADRPQPTVAPALA